VTDNICVSIKSTGVWKSQSDYT